jgi:hypothetical protein
MNWLQAELEFGDITNVSPIQSQPQKQKSAHRYVPMGGLIVDPWSVRHSPAFLLFALFVLNLRIFPVGLFLLLGFLGSNARFG